MRQEFDFRGLIVLDLANNHQGSVEHGLRIIRAMAEVIRDHEVRAAIKFQFRQLDNFIHPDFRDDKHDRHIPRFISTALKRKDFERMLAEIRDQGLLAMCTPFDEESVDLISEMGFDILKVASCSAVDWPLLEKVAQANLPVICSTGGLDLEAVDNLNSFFFHRGVDSAIMHCVTIYPTPNDMLHLNNIAMMRKRYPDRVIGWSTHEDPDNTAAVQVAVAKGAEIFERHVGLPTDEIKLNAYSSTPEQIDRWLTAYRQARAMCGSYDRLPAPKVERDSIVALQRGVYVKKPAKKGTRLTRDRVFFAMPCQEGQLSSGRWEEGVVVKADRRANEPVMLASVSLPNEPADVAIKHSIHRVKALLNEAGVPLNSEFAVEYSHHYGLENFHETGAVLIACVNRDYCKKIIVQLPGQFHPKHFHKTKEETFQVLQGVLEVDIDGHRRTLNPGETCLIQPGVWHCFWTETGVVFEEISTRDVSGDSYYADKKINEMTRPARKTIVDHWGRFQLPDRTAKRAKA